VEIIKGFLLGRKRQPAGAAQPEQKGYYRTQIGRFWNRRVQRGGRFLRMFGRKSSSPKILRAGAARAPAGRRRSTATQAPRRTSGPRAAE